MPETKNKVEPVVEYQLRDERALYIVNKTGVPVNVFFTQTDESATLELRK